MIASDKEGDRAIGTREHNLTKLVLLWAQRRKSSPCVAGSEAPNRLAHESSEQSRLRIIDKSVFAVLFDLFDHIAAKLYGVVIRL